jgi:ATP-dependent Lon protease
VTGAITSRPLCCWYEISPVGGQVTLAKLFVNNSTGKLGLVSYWDVVAFDDFAGAGKSVNKTLVDVLKNYMANRSFSLGTEQLTADASTAFVGNTSKSVSYMLKHSHLFADLPDKYQDSAFMDRAHFYIRGWEVGIIRNEMFTDGFGFIVDYLAQVFKHQRFQDYVDVCRKHFELDASLSTRDKGGIYKTASGLLKIIFPHRDVTKDEVEWILFAIEGRKRIKTEIMKMDRTFDPVQFQYTDLETGETKSVQTKEEVRYPHFFRAVNPDEEESDRPEKTTSSSAVAGGVGPKPAGPRHCP